MEFLILLFLAAGGFFYISHVLAQKKRARLLDKYGDASVVDRIMRKMFWQGQTPEQLRDSIGSPADIDTKVMKKKNRQVWKYHPAGANRYRLRITIENGYVVGWEQK